MLNNLQISVPIELVIFVENREVNNETITIQFDDITTLFEDEDNTVVIQNLKELLNECVKTHLPKINSLFEILRSIKKVQQIFMRK